MEICVHMLDAGPPRSMTTRLHLFGSGDTFINSNRNWKQEGLAVASIARDDPYTLPGDDPFRHARMHRDRIAQ